jgi:acetylornithine aminotransferase
LRDAFAPDKPPVAALFIEPIQGEAGVKPLPASYLQLARELTSANGALLVIDEIQTGMGRTGSWFAHQHRSFSELGAVQPDVMTLAKGLGGGFPMGAVIAFGPKAAVLLGPGMHGSTFGGNPLAAAAGLAVIDTIANDSLLENTSASSEALTAAIAAANHPEIQEIRGLGLLLAVQLRSPIAAEVAARALELGLIVNPVTADAIRIAPPLILSKAQAQEIATKLLAAISD